EARTNQCTQNSTPIAGLRHGTHDRPFPGRASSAPPSRLPKSRQGKSELRQPSDHRAARPDIVAASLDGGEDGSAAANKQPHRQCQIAPYLIHQRLASNQHRISLIDQRGEHFTKCRIALSRDELRLTPAMTAANLLRNINASAGEVASYVLPEIRQLQPRAD